MSTLNNDHLDGGSNTSFPGRQGSVIAAALPGLPGLEEERSNNSPEHPYTWTTAWPSGYSPRNRPGKVKLYLNIYTLICSAVYVLSKVFVLLHRMSLHSSLILLFLFFTL